MNGCCDTIETRLRTAPGPFGPLLPAGNPTADSTNPELAIASSGNGALALTEQPGGVGDDHIAVAGIDGAGPVITTVQAPASGERSNPLQFSAAAADAWSAVSLAFDFGDGSQAAGPSAEHAYAAGGGFTVTVTATDGAGNASSATRQVTIADSKPTIGRVRMRRRRFRVGRAPTPKAAIPAARSSAKRGSDFRFTLSETATVRIEIRRLRRGRPRGRKRVLRRRLAGGAQRVAFSGRVGKKALKPGRYQAVLRATDLSGRRSAAKRIRFRIVRR